MAQQKIAIVSEIPVGTMHPFFIAGKRITLANVDGEFFAVDDTCTHSMCSLGGEGFLDGNVITCGCHGAQYDVANGKVLALPATVDLSSYAVTVVGNDILVDL
jgi:3-phenylpropionate/trans-cinnamate dioxygenase ferredoxin subunit